MRFQLALAGLAMAWASAALAQPPRALVIGNGVYAFLPPLPGCLASAKLVASALRGAGVSVTEKTDLSSGAMQAALDAFTHGSGNGALIYICGYASGFNDRDFMLPVSASVARPPDVLAQGVLAKSIVDAASGATGAVVLDTVAVPNASVPLGFDILKTMKLPAGTGVAVAAESAPADGPTSVATALGAVVKSPGFDMGAVLKALRASVPSSAGTRFVVMRASEAPASVAPPPHATAPPSPPPPVVAVAPPAVTPPAVVPDEAHMTDADRRRIQIALAQLGYYDGRIDGLFGPDTQAAIRRFQHELKADMTGTLTPEQVARLLK